MLAMDVNDNACCLNARVVLASIASMLAPTKKQNKGRTAYPLAKRCLLAVFKMMS